MLSEEEEKDRTLGKERLQGMAHHSGKIFLPPGTLRQVTRDGICIPAKAGR